MSNETQKTRQKWTKEQIMLLLVVIATVWAAGYATSAVNRSETALMAVDEAVMQVQDSAFCNKQVLGDALTVLNARTANSGPQAAANIELQKAQLRFTTTILRPEATENQRTEELTRYVKAQNMYLQEVTQTKKVADETAYPEDDAVDACLAKRIDDRAANGSQR